MADPAVVPKRSTQSVFAEAIKSRSSTDLLTHLAQLTSDQGLVDRLARLVKRAGGLIHERPDGSGQKKRDALLSDIRNYLALTTAGLNLEQFDDACRIVHIAEEGYHRILGILERTEFAKLDPATRAAAVVARMEANLSVLRADTEAALVATGKVIMPGGANLRGADGQLVSSDAVVSGMVSSLSGTLMMEGYANGWFDKKGWLVLPTLPLASDADIFRAGSSEYLSASWRKWGHLEQTARFEDTEILELAGSDLPREAPEGVELVLQREATCQTYDLIANERAMDREGISALDLHKSIDVGSVGKGVEAAVAAAPEEWVSPEELSNTLSLSEALGYEILKDEKEYGGLRLSQWVRGYAALAAWVEARQTVDRKGLLTIAQSDLKALLERVSLTASNAEQFMDAVSFGRGSRDLFDAPLVRSEGDWLLIAPALAAPRLARIIPSLLASKKIQIERKGKAFEARVIAMLEKQNLKPKLVKVNREGGEYDFDVLVPWGDYIFHFECKNHGLSGNDPAQAHYFIKEIEDNLEQVERLRDALSKWPDILTDAFGAEALEKTVVHCILENETFCLPEPINGIYVYDWSSLSRFFQEGWFNVIELHNIGGEKVENRVGLKRIWSGEKPTAKDLLVEMGKPSQYRIVEHHLDVQHSVFHLDEVTLACDFILTRRPVTTESMASAHGVPFAEIAAKFAAGNAQMEDMKRRLEEGRPAEHE